ncbi:MAG: hypothetical protein MJZ68_05705 [archaeon]|nr:hypothetical protein [archaeon]
MDGKARNYILAAMIPLLLGTVAIVVSGTDVLDLSVTVITLSVCIPLTVMGLYMYLEGRGSGFINGVDWSRYSDTERMDLSSYMGKYIVAGSVLMSVSLSVIIGHMFLGLVLIVVSVLLMVAPIAKIGEKVRPRTVHDSGRKILFYVLSVGLILLATLGLGLEDGGHIGAEITLDEDSFSVSAPFFDETFVYSEVQGLASEPGFKKGSRIMGLEVPSFESGTFRNSVFGKYTLAAYTDVGPCICFLYHGHHYAFNQSTEETTYAMYLELVERTES